jgi:gluconate:H+ symporter, GntP family
MDVILVFLLTLIVIFLMAYSRQVPVFVVLLSGAIFFGLLAGAGPDKTLKWTIDGMGSMFSGFAIIVLSGIVIVRLLSDQNLLGVMLQGIQRRIKNPHISSGVLGYILAVPITCPIATYWVLAPVLKNLEPEKVRANALLYMAALGGITSYILVYPTPATQPLFTAFSAGFPAISFDTVTIPLSLCLLIILLMVSGWWYLPRNGITGRGSNPDEGYRNRLKENEGSSLPLQFRAWAPFIAILAAIPAGSLLLGLSHVGIMQFIMLAGLGTALVMAPREIRLSGFTEGAKTAGLVLFDICAAGAISTVVIQSGLAKTGMNLLIAAMPDIIIPFLIAALLATAQGSRVVTAVVSAQVIGATALVREIHPLPMVLMAAAGSCIVCHLTDPFFWAIQRTTDDTEKTLLKNYTLPLACIGAVIFLVALVLVLLVFPYQENAALSFIE